jgi:hypothetical protein
VLAFGWDAQAMKLFNGSVTVGLAVVFVVGCASNKELHRIDLLKRDPDWPRIRAAAELEIARREGNTSWSYDAYFSPREHTNRVWAVVASGAYPANRWGDSIDLLIRDGGEVLAYSPRWGSHPK